MLYGAVPVRHANHLAMYREPYEIARFLETGLAREESAVIVATSFAGEVPMPYQRIFGQLDIEKERLLCTFLIQPEKLKNVESFIQEHNLRFIIVFGDGEQLRGKEEAVFLQFISAHSNIVKKVFSNEMAVIYERLS